MCTRSMYICNNTNGTKRSVMRMDFHIMNLETRDVTWVTSEIGWWNQHKLTFL